MLSAGWILARASVRYRVYSSLVDVVVGTAAAAAAGKYIDNKIILLFISIIIYG